MSAKTSKSKTKASSVATKTKRPVAAAPHRIIRRASDSLRQTSARVREEVAAHKRQIAAEAAEALREAEVAGSVQTIRVLFGQQETELLTAIDAYAAAHGLNSRAQVVRVALGKLLKQAVAIPKWGWPAGRARKLDSPPANA